MNPKDDQLYKILIEMGPPGTPFEALDYEDIIKAVRSLTAFEPTPEQQARARHSQATSALEHLKVEDLDHGQRVELFNKLVGLLAGA